MNIRQLKRYFLQVSKMLMLKDYCVHVTVIYIIILFIFILIMRIMNFICRTLDEERQEDMSASFFVKKKLYADTKR